MDEPSLRDLQRWMKSRIRPSGTGVPGAAPQVLNPQRGTPGVERLAVYGGGYVTRIRQALAEVYEAVRHVVGERTFTELAHGYAQRYPSREYNLSLAGRHLPAFLAEWPLTTRLPFLPDLARLEWAVCRAFHAFEQPPLDAGRLTGLPLEAWDRSRLVFQPSVGVVASAWPILDLWASRATPRSAVRVDLVDRPQRVLIFRQQLQVRCELVDERRYAVLEGLLDGRTLGAVCAELAAQGGQGAPPLAEWFAGWAARGLIVGCDAA